MKDFFKEKLKCTNVPKQVVEFYSKHDGQRLEINDIFSKKEILENLEDFQEYLNSGIKHDEGALLIPIADDGMGGYYAFVGNKKDENIYYFDHEYADEDPSVVTLEEIINMSDELQQD